MPDLNDFHAFNSTSGGSGGGGGGWGCLRPWMIIVAIIILLTLLGECSG